MQRLKDAILLKYVVPLRNTLYELTLAQRSCKIMSKSKVFVLAPSQGKINAISLQKYFILLRFYAAQFLKSGIADHLTYYIYHLQVPVQVVRFIFTR